MMQSLSGKIVAALLSFFLLLYVGYQGYRHFAEVIQTQTVFDYTVQDAEKIKGLIVRNEAVMDQAVNGVVSYFNDDGIKVAIGTAVAEVYTSKSDVIGRKRIRELDNEIAQLATIENLGSSYYLNSEGISKQLSESLYAVIKSNESGILTDIPLQRSALLANLNRKQLATGVTENFSGKAARLEAEKQKLESSLAGGSTVISADAVGYFSSYVDGLESRLSMESVRELSAEELENIIDTNWEQDQARMGKIIEHGSWNFVIVKELDDMEPLYEGLRLNVDFGIPSYQAIPARVTSVRDDRAANRRIITLSCDYMCPELTRLRNPIVELNYQQYSGLKIPSQAVRFQNDERGVYVKNGDMVTFKTIDVIYEGRGYILCAENKLNNNSVKLYDEVVVSGMIPESAMPSIADSRTAPSNANSDTDKTEVSNSNSTSNITSSVSQSDLLPKNTQPATSAETPPLENLQKGANE